MKLCLANERTVPVVDCPECAALFLVFANFMQVFAWSMKVEIDNDIDLDGRKTPAGMDDLDVPWYDQK